MAVHYYSPSKEDHVIVDAETPISRAAEWVDAHKDAILLLDLPINDLLPAPRVLR